MSELKLSDIWDDATNAVCQAMQESKMCKCKDGECIAAKIEPSAETVLHWNTRAAPDVPELVRYSVRLDEGRYFGMAEYAGGKYVLHSQAATAIYKAYSEASNIIAAKDAEISKLNVYNRSYHAQIIELRELIKAAEAKLAQIKAQEPVAWVRYEAPYQPTVVFGKDKPSHSDARMGKYTPLYASPAPAADLKAEKSDYFMINDGVSYIHPELGEGVFFTDDLLKPSLPENKKYGVTDDIRQLIVAAREVAYGGTIRVNSEEYNNLDKALEKFSGDVDWENQP